MYCSFRKHFQFFFWESQGGYFHKKNMSVTRNQELVWKKKCCIKILTTFKLWVIFQVHMQCVKIVQKRSFFSSVFYRIMTEYGEILRISLHLVRMRENTDQKKLCFWTLFTQWWFISRFVKQNVYLKFHLAYKILTGKLLSI